MRTSYADIIQLLLEKAPPTATLAGSDKTLRVEAGAVLADVLAGRKAEFTLTTDLLLSIPPSVPDRLGHSRISYWPMLLHCLFRAQRLQADLLPPETAEMWRRVTPCALALTPWPTKAWPAMQGSLAVNMLLHAVILNDVGDDQSQLGRDAISRFTAMQQPSGAWLAATASDNPETHWFDELVILHALANAWAATGDADIGAGPLSGTRCGIWPRRSRIMRRTSRGA